MKYLICLGMSLAFVHAASAQENRGGYLGFSVGSFSYEEEDEDFGIVVIDDTTSAYRIIGGYRFNDHFALEGGWGKTGDFEENFTELVPPFGTITFSLSGEYEVLMVRALGIVPFERVSLLGGVGYYDADLDYTISVTGFGAGAGEAGDDGATLVGGFEFNLERLDIRTEVEWFDSDDGVKAWDFSVGLLFRF
jgi:OmpA-OmpF porin, OOP family